MLFPGVVLPKAVLDKSDLAILRSKARNSGRDFGGAPLYDNTRRDPYDQQNRGGRINYAADRAPMRADPPPPPAYANGNPFAALLDPRYAQGAPPPPQQYGGHQGYDRNYSNGYANQQTGDQYRGATDQAYYGVQQGQYQSRGQHQQGGHQNGGRSVSDGYHYDQDRSRDGRRGNGGYRNSGGYDQGSYNRR